MRPRSSSVSLSSCRSASPLGRSGLRERLGHGLLGYGVLGSALLGAALLGAACAAVPPARPSPPLAPLVSTTLGHIEHIAEDSPSCLLARSLWTRTVEEFARTHAVPSVPTGTAADECH